MPPGTALALGRQDLGTIEVGKRDALAVVGLDDRATTLEAVTRSSETVAPSCRRRGAGGAVSLALAAVEAVRTRGRMVKFSTVCCSPVRFDRAALAAARYGISWSQVAWIVVAMGAARNAAMGFNRLADHAIDGRNPRTAGRELRARSRAVWAFTILLAALFVAASFRLNPLCGVLRLALAIVFGYSFTSGSPGPATSLLGCRSPCAGGRLAGGRRTIRDGAGPPPPRPSGSPGSTFTPARRRVRPKRGAVFVPARSACRARWPRRGIPRFGPCFDGRRPLRRAPRHLLVGPIVVAGVLVWEHRRSARTTLEVGVAFFNANGMISVLFRRRPRGAGARKATP
jgi:hypothetical protein